MPKTTKAKSRTRSNGIVKNSHPYQRELREACAGVASASGPSTPLVTGEATVMAKSELASEEALPSTASTHGTSNATKRRRRKSRPKVPDMNGKVAAPAAEEGPQDVKPDIVMDTDENKLEVENDSVEVASATTTAVDAAEQVQVQRGTSADVEMRKSKRVRSIAPETPDAIMRRLVDKGAASIKAAGSSRDDHKSKHKRELRELQRKLDTVQEQATKDADELRKRAEEAEALQKRINEAEEVRKRVEELEKELEDKKRELESQKAELEVKTKLLTDHDTHSDKVKDALNCTVCFEHYSDPHVLTCGHTACKRCLVQWFRSANAYSSEDIRDVQPGDDLTFRSKVCHLCREPVCERPVRMFALRAVMEQVGLVSPEEAAMTAIADREDDPWAKTFPPHRSTYVLADDSDDIDRCPRCMCEIAGGECQGCGAEFSIDGSADGFSLNGSDDDQFDSEYDSFSDEEPGGLLPWEPNAMDRLDGLVNNYRDGHPIPGYHHDHVHIDLDGAPGDDDSDSGLSEVNRFLEEGSEDDDNPAFDRYRHLLVGPLGNRTPSPHRLIDDEAEDSDGHESVSTFGGGRRTRSTSPSNILRNEIVRRALSPADEEGYSSYDEDYESSFIDDDDSVHDFATAGEDGDDVDEDSDEDDDEDAPPRTLAFSDASDNEADEPSLDILRQRRAARYAPPPERPAPIARAQRRRVIVDSDDE